MAIQTIRLILGISAGVVIFAALVAFGIILFKIYKKKQEIKKNEIKIAQEISNNVGEKKMNTREDFGEALVDLQQLLGKTINHEIVEFCINSCIRNEYKKILLLGDVEVYESITLSNKANVEVFVKEKDFDNEKYIAIKDQIKSIKYKLNIIDEIQNDQKFDAIMLLNSFDYFDVFFNKNEKYLVKKGMFIVANSKSNKKSVKNLIKEVEAHGYRYDVINWYTGFIIIVK